MSDKMIEAESPRAEPWYLIFWTTDGALNSTFVRGAVQVQQVVAMLLEGPDAPPEAAAHIMDEFHDPDAWSFDGDRLSIDLEQDHLEINRLRREQYTGLDWPLDAVTELAALREALATSSKEDSE